MTKDFWVKVGFVSRGKNRIEIIKLIDKPQTPSALCQRTKLNMNLVSRALRELEKEGVVECKNPKETMGRVYDLTELGRKVLKSL